MEIWGDFDVFKSGVRSAIETSLSQALRSYPETVVREAAQYVVLGGGHRWRALVAVAAGRVFHDEALDLTLPAACGVELAHAASLVLDDLPSMDDAQYRRGKPCVHLQYPHWAVDLLPAYLVNAAYQISLDNPRVPAERTIAAALRLAKAGALMMEGQERDLAQRPGSEVSERELLSRYRRKSGALYSTAAEGGGMLCGASDAETRLLAACGAYLGIHYQFQDDIADVVAGASQLGKPTGMDQGKVTAVDLFGVEGAKKRAAQFVEASLAAIDQFGSEADLLRQLVCNATWAAL